MLINLLQSVGEALTREQQEFVSANLMKIHQFTNTPAGKSAVAQFTAAWQYHHNKPAETSLEKS